MTYLFHDLDKLCSAFNFSINHPQGLSKLTRDFRSETDKIQAQLKDIYFKPCCNQTFEKFITLHHTVLVERLDNFSLQIANSPVAFDSLSPAEAHNYNEAVLSAYCQLSDLLEFIHTYFNRFIPRHLPIPKQSLSAPIQEIREAKEFVELVLNKSHPADLRSLIIKPFTEFLSAKNKPTWHCLFYCRAIHTELKWLTENILPDTESLMWMLYRLNFNHPSFYTLLTSYILQLDPENYLKTLYDTQRKIRQLNIIPNIIYSDDHSPIDKLIQNWLIEEINYIEKTAQIPLAISACASIPEKASAEKLQANMSVAELAFLFKAMADTGLIKISNYKEFFHAMVRTYRTKQSENISVDSFRTKFYMPEPGIQKAVKRHIISVMNHINLSS